MFVKQELLYEKVNKAYFNINKERGSFCLCLGGATGCGEAKIKA
jgi:hypothetical protein